MASTRPHGVHSGSAFGGVCRQGRANLSKCQALRGLGRSMVFHGLGFNCFNCRDLNVLTVVTLASLSHLLACSSLRLGGISGTWAATRCTQTRSGRAGAQLWNRDSGLGFGGLGFEWFGGLGFGVPSHLQPGPQAPTPKSQTPNPSLLSTVALDPGAMQPTKHPRPTCPRLKHPFAEWALQRLLTNSHQVPWNSRLPCDTVSAAFKRTLSY
jgi:hypothetical protein